MSGFLLLACTALLIDCDGVLVDSDASVERAWTRWSHEFDLDPAVVNDAVHGRRVVDSVAALISPDRRAEATALVNTYELQDAASVTAIPGAVQLTSSLPPASWAVVTSGTSALARARLTAAGHRVPAVTVTADDVDAGKPAPDGYLAAAAGLGVLPGQCVVLEDSGNGVGAARAAGVGMVLGIGARALETDADVVVADLTGVHWVADGLQVDAAGLLRGP